MKYAAIASLFAAQTLAYENEFDAGKKYVKIVEGFLMGAIEAEGFTDIEQCIQDGEVIFRDAESAYEHFAKKDITDAIDGVKDIGNAITEISAALKDCSSVKGDWAKMKKIGEEFKHPTSFAWHIAGDIWHNRVDIGHEVTAAIGDWESQNWYDFGLQCGKAASNVFIGKETQHNIQMEKASAITAGFLNSYGGSFNLENLLLCIYQEDQAALFLDVAYQALQKAIHDTNWNDRIGDIIGTGIGVVGAYQQFEQGLPVCEAIVSSKFDLEPINKDVEFVANPMQNIAQITKNIGSYQGKIEEAIAHYDNEDYEKFGEFMGQIVQVMANGQKEDLFLY